MSAARLSTLLVLGLLACAACLADDGQVARAGSTPALHSPDGLAEVQLLLQAPQGAYLGRMRFQPGARAPEHRHDGSEELVYILSGQGEMNLAGRLIAVEAGTAVRIPAGVPHSFVTGGDEAMEVIQIYNPGGPEQRFRAWEMQGQEARP